MVYVITFRENRVYERSGSFFEDSNVSLDKIIALLHFWAHNLPVKTTASLLGLTMKAVITWHSKLRAICQIWLYNNPRQIGGRVGGRRLTVEIDESLVARRKYHR